MKINFMIDAINHIDLDLIEEYTKEKELLKIKNISSKKNPWLRWASLAACLCAVIALSIFTIYQIQNKANPNIPPIVDNETQNSEDLWSEEPPRIDSIHFGSYEELITAVQNSFAGYYNRESVEAQPETTKTFDEFTADLQENGVPVPYLNDEAMALPNNINGDSVITLFIEETFDLPQIFYRPSEISVTKDWYITTTFIPGDISKEIKNSSVSELIKTLDPDYPNIHNYEDQSLFKIVYEHDITLQDRTVSSMIIEFSDYSDTIVYFIYDDLLITVAGKPTDEMFSTLSFKRYTSVPEELDISAFTAPICDHGYLSAEDVANMLFFDVNFSKDSMYETVYHTEQFPHDSEFSPVPKDQYIPDISNDRYVDVYKIEQKKKDLSSDELYSLKDKILENLLPALGKNTVITDTTESNTDDQLNISYNCEPDKGDGIKYNVSFSQSTGGNVDNNIEFASNRVTLTASKEGRPINLKLNNKPLKILLEYSEDEIIASLRDEKNILFDIFDRRFNSVKVVFDYGNGTEPQVKGVSVYYYNKTQVLPDGRLGDNIMIHFNYCDDESSSITYTEYRQKCKNFYSVEARCLLNYSAQEVLREEKTILEWSPFYKTVECADLYDEFRYVGFEYKTGICGDTVRAIPFYTLYQLIGSTENGNCIFAKSYISTIELLDYRKYSNTSSNS